MTENTPQKTQSTRDAIVDAAYELFLANGFHGTSMRQIASRAGLVVAGIYNHFPSKEAVYTAVILAYHPFYRMLPALAQAQGQTVEEFMQDAARRLVDALGSEKKYLRLMFIEVVEFDNRHLPALIEKILPDLQEFVRGLFARQGALRPYPPIVILRSFLGMFFSYFMSEIMITPYLPKEYSAEAFDAFLEIYLHGVLVPAPAGAE